MNVLFLESHSDAPLRAFLEQQPHPYRLLAGEDRWLLVVEAASPETVAAGLALEGVRGWVFALEEEGCGRA